MRGNISKQLKKFLAVKVTTPTAQLKLVTQFLTLIKKYLINNIKLTQTHAIIGSLKYEITKVIILNCQAFNWSPTLHLNWVCFSSYLLLKPLLDSDPVKLINP